MAKARIRPRSWRFANTVTWHEGKQAGLTAEGRPDLGVATPPEFGGPEGIWGPEDFLVAAVNSCILTTFLYLRGRAGIELVSYQGDSEGTVVYTDGALKFSEVTVRPRVTVASEENRERAAEALKRAEETCLISNSLDCAVNVEPSIEVAAG